MGKSKRKSGKRQASKQGRKTITQTVGLARPILALLVNVLGTCSTWAIQCPSAVLNQPQLCYVVIYYN